MSRNTTVMIPNEAAVPEGRGVPPARGRSFPSWHPLVVGGGLLAIIALARPLAEWRLPFPPCWLRKFTGVPCPSCGCTRSLLELARMDPVQAFLFNPLFTLLCAGVLLWPVLAAFEKISGRAWFSRAWARIPRRRAWQIAAGLVALNWLYLCLRLPK